MATEGFGYLEGELFYGYGGSGNAHLRKGGLWTVAATYVIQASNGHSESFVRRSSIDPLTPLLCIFLSKSGRLGMKTLLAKGLTLCGWRAVM